MTELVEALMPLFDRTVISSAERYPLLSCQILIIFGMLHCLEARKSNSAFANDHAKCVKTYFAEYNFDKGTSLTVFLDLHFIATFYQASGQHMMLLKKLVTRELQAPDISPSEDTAMSAPTSSLLVASTVWNAFDLLVMNDAG